ncbi:MULTISPECIES: DMT family transporter [Shewanella]|uniref:DMT family transporter n=2 Tax=Shewanellaceae TaxID=267890 RepID=UPI000CB6B221|nr:MULTISPECIES: DMT family transporter [Shewanella]NCQ46688.1 DMT family transporter [Shewanella frigidimarina]NCO71339.1 DMT family transporter [Shewanella vesiculosa]NCP37817.1 DMT family transporter [Shewanella vesiculosa]NCP70128.1 DMT family transporter [Shewanella vesiculosa]NCP75108.1 DMT family transporter [Shewanella vesiculosa]
MWIMFTFLAAFMQAWRNAFQSKLSKDVSVAGVTLARFIWAGPIAAVYLFSLHQYSPTVIPTFNASFWGFVIGASSMQILATGLMVKLFKMQNYAIGAGLAKSEALVAAILGVIFFGTQLSILGWIGVVIGGLAVMLLSSKQGFKQLSLKTVLLGLACGSAFALTSLWVREASLTLQGPFTHRAAWVLLWVIGLQTIVLIGYLLAKDKSTLAALWQRPKLTLAISVSSCIGSIGWFSAMSLQAVPYVKTLGQVEVFFTLIIATFWLKQKVKINDVAGLLLIAIAAILVMWS